MEAFLEELCRALARRNKTEVSPAVLAALEVVGKLLGNVAKDPSNQKFREVRPANAAISNKLSPIFKDVFKEPNPILLLDRLGFHPPPEKMATGSSSASSSTAVVPSYSVGINVKNVALTDSLVCTMATVPPLKDLQLLQRYLADKAMFPRAIQIQQNKLEQERRKKKAEDANSGAQQQLQDLRSMRSKKYQSQQDQALALHLSKMDDDAIGTGPVDVISLLNEKKDRYVTCTSCKQSLKYRHDATELVLCPCGTIVSTHPYRAINKEHLLPEPGEPVDPTEATKMRGQPMIRLTVAGEEGGDENGQGGGERSSSSRGEREVHMPLHQFLTMVRNSNEGKAKEATDTEISQLPQRLLVRCEKDRLHESDNEICRICMEDYFEDPDVDSVSVRTLPCLHFFHSNCIDQWLKVNKVCPTCRFEI